MKYRKGMFQGLQAKRAQAWILNKESGPGEKIREGGKTMGSRESRGHWCRMGNSRALDVQGKKGYLGSMVASWAFIYIVSYILDHNSLHRQNKYSQNYGIPTQKQWDWMSDPKPMILAPVSIQENQRVILRSWDLISAFGVCGYGIWGSLSWDFVAG